MRRLTNVECCESRAKQRRGICGRQIIRDTHEPGALRNHHLGISAIRMNAGEFLVTTVHEIAISTEFAITARASEEADTDALTNRPSLDARAKGIDPPDHFVPRDARPADWKGGFHRAGIRVADTARLDTNTHLTGARIDQRFHYGFEFSRLRYLDCSIHCTHIASFMASHSVWLEPAPSLGNRRSQSTHGCFCSSQKMQYVVQIDGIWRDLFQSLEKTRDAMSSN